MNLTDPLGLFVSLAIVIVLLSIWLLARLDERAQQRRLHLRVRAARRREPWDHR